MNRETEIRKRRGTRVLLIVLAIWGLAVVVAAQTEIYKAIYPLVLASIIALGYQPHHGVRPSAPSHRDRTQSRGFPRRCRAETGTALLAEPLIKSQ
jgi:hypothetical protein